jgi:hypothetical protein
LFQELGTIAGRLLFAFLVVRIATQKHLLRVFLVPGLIVFSCVYYFAACGCSNVGYFWPVSC